MWSGNQRVKGCSGYCGRLLASCRMQSSFFSITFNSSDVVQVGQRRTTWKMLLNQMIQQILFRQPEFWRKNSNIFKAQIRSFWRENSSSKFRYETLKLQRVPTCFRWEVSVKISNLREIRILSAKIQTSNQVKWIHSSTYK